MIPPAGLLTPRDLAIPTSDGLTLRSWWWDHPEAVDRLRALHLQQLVAMPTKDDPAGSLSSWWVDHWDRHAVVLFGRTGPFGQCRDGHVRREPLELDTPPEDLQL